MQFKLQKLSLLLPIISVQVILTKNSAIYIPPVNECVSNTVNSKNIFNAD